MKNVIVIIILIIVGGCSSNKNVHKNNATSNRFSKSFTEADSVFTQKYGVINFNNNNHK